MLLNRIYWLLLLALTLSACASVDLANRRSHTDAIAAQQQWKPIRLPAHPFVLAAYIPSMPVKNEVLSVYIEGDGLAWLTRSQVSTDPTPLNPIGLELALRHSKGTAVYLARPCQYVQGADSVGCKAGYWTKRRFSAEIVSASSLAIDQLKQMFGATKIVLVGYSGGGRLLHCLRQKGQMSFS